MENIPCYKDDMVEIFQPINNVSHLWGKRCQILECKQNLVLSQICCDVAIFSICNIYG